MPIYMIQAGVDGVVKIGFTDRADPAFRLNQLQISHYETLRLLRVIIGTRSHKRWLHAYFWPLRIRAEWFRFDPEMRTVNPGLLESVYSRRMSVEDQMTIWHRDVVFTYRNGTHARPGAGEER